MGFILPPNRKSELINISGNSPKIAHLNVWILAFSTNFCPKIDYPYLRVSWKDDRWNPLGDSNWCKSVGIYCSREREIKFYPLVIFQLDWRTAASEAVRGCRRGWKNFSSIFDSFQEDDGWRPKEKKRKREDTVFENHKKSLTRWFVYILCCKKAQMSNSKWIFEA